MDKKIRENLRDTRNSLFLNETISRDGQLSFQRPLLILLDRNFDLATPLHHTWTYQALMHDLLNFKLNRIEIEKSTTSSASSSSRESKTYDLSNTDKFWKLQKGSTFPVVAESVQEELEKYKQYENELKSLKDTLVKKPNIKIKFSIKYIKLFQIRVVRLQIVRIRFLIVLVN